MIKAKTVASLFRYPKRWCKGDYAKNKEKVGIDVYDADACSWCLEGAIKKVYPDNPDRILEKLSKLINSNLFGAIPNWNDKPKRTFEQVKALVIKAGI